MAKAVTPAQGAESAKKRVYYRCFLLRCQRQESAEAGLPADMGGEPAWRFTVQEAGRDGARRSFTSLKDVEAYLAARLGLPGWCAAGRAE